MSNYVYYSHNLLVGNYFPEIKAKFKEKERSLKSCNRNKSVEWFSLVRKTVRIMLL